MFLDGKNQAILNEMAEAMETAAASLEFERAAKYRDQITQLRKVQEQQYVHGTQGDVDVFAIALASGAACVQGLFIRGGRLLGQRTWFPRNELHLGEADLLDAFLSQYYLAGTRREIPKDVISAEALPDGDLLEAALTTNSGRRVNVSHQVRGQRARWRDLARENARSSLQAYLADKQNVYARFVALQDALGLEDLPAAPGMF